MSLIFQLSKILLSDSDLNSEDRNEIHRWFAFKLIGEQTSELDIQQIKEMLGNLIYVLSHNLSTKSVIFQPIIWQRDL
jgi:hypothetical protein